MARTLRRRANATAGSYNGCTLSLRDAILDLLREPRRHLLRRWNHKSAITSALTRAPLFLAANASAGPAAAGGAFVAEFLLRLATAGFYGALTQALRQVEPARTATLAAIVVLPLLSHLLELLVHWSRGTANLGLSLALSMAFTGVSTWFSLFAMRQGVLTVGDADSRTLSEDLRALPGVIAAFLRSTADRWRGRHGAADQGAGQGPRVVASAGCARRATSPQR